MAVATAQHGPAAIVSCNREQESDSGCRGCHKIRDDEVYKHAKLQATSNGSSNGVASRDAISGTHH